MKKNYFIIAMLLTAFAVNAQTPVTIENGDFSLPADAAKYTTINSIPGWKSDDLVDNDSGREANYIAYMFLGGGSIYNVLSEVIPTTSKTYRLTFDAWGLWSITDEVDYVITFSSLAVGADPTTRVPITTVTLPTVAPINASHNYSAEVTIPDAATYAGANLVIEFDCSGPTNPYFYVDMDNFALTRTDVTTKVQNVESTSLKTYPNPFNNNVAVESAEIIKNISIYSVNGQRIKDLTVNSAKANIATSDLSKGVYVLKVETGNGIKTMNVVK